jgi:hypothetical protein
MRSVDPLGIRGVPGSGWAECAVDTRSQAEGVVGQNQACALVLWLSFGLVFSDDGGGGAGEGEGGEAEGDGSEADAPGRVVEE